MLSTRSILLPLIVAIAILSTGCASLGVTRTGNVFNYENVDQIKEGETTKAEVKTLLEGEPVNTGKQAYTGYFTEYYQYSESSGASAWTRYIPVARWISVGKTVVTDFRANISYDGDIVAAIDYNKTKTGSESAGI